MTSQLLATILVAATLAATPAIARAPVPIDNYENIAVATSSGKPLQIEQVKQAIQAAAAVKGWTIAYQADGSLLATLNVRNKHTITVELPYSVEKYSLRYKGSTAMKYGQRDGIPVIHPYYNKWVQEFKETIRIELLKL